MLGPAIDAVRPGPDTEYAVRSGERPPCHRARRRASAGHIGAGKRHVLRARNRSARLRGKTGIDRFRRSTAKHGPKIKIDSTRARRFSDALPALATKGQDPISGGFAVRVFAHRATVQTT